MQKSKIFLCLLIPLISQCTLMQRSPSSGYYETSAPEGNWRSYVNSQNVQAFREAKYELGYAGQELSDSQRQAVWQRVELKKLENNLRIPTEIDQYYQHKPYMASDRERIQFLKMGDMYDRQAWLEQNVNVRPAFSRNIASAISKKDLVPNMSRQAVIDSWGEPDEKEVAGNPVYGNEKWTYNYFSETDEGEAKEDRMLFFENGLLVGWETR